MADLTRLKAEVAGSLADIQAEMRVKRTEIESLYSQLGVLQNERLRLEKVEKGLLELSSGIEASEEVGPIR